MLSICIPIHDYYAYPLVRRLTTQIEKLEVSDQVEIVCIDDHSSGYYLNQNKGISEIATFLRLNENIGLSRIRSLFLKHSHGEWLLFLDNDSQVPENFLKNYLKAIQAHPSDVIVGGRVFDKKSDDKEHRLRYTYGTLVESRPLSVRTKNPYRSFSTHNFAIRRDVLEHAKIDATLAKYGHEDILLAYRFEQQKIPILHIDNPVTNGYLQTSLEFLHNTVENITDLVKIYDYMWEDQYFCNNVPLLHTYAKVRRLGLIWAVKFLFKIFKTPIETHLVSGNKISLKQFKFYKLGIFIEKLQKGNN